MCVYGGEREKRGSEKKERERKKEREKKESKRERERKGKERLKQDSEASECGDAIGVEARRQSG